MYSKITAPGPSLVSFSGNSPAQPPLVPRKPRLLQTADSYRRGIALLLLGFKVLVVRRFSALSFQEYFCCFLHGSGGEQMAHKEMRPLSHSGTDV